MMWKIQKHKPTGTHFVTVPLVAAVSMMIMIAGLVILLWSAERGRDTQLQVRQAGDFAALLPSIVGLTQASLDSGNQARLLENGDQFFPSLEDIGNARASVRLAPSGPTQAHIAYTSPTGSVSSVQVLYYLAINAARREVLIQNPYMLPSHDAIEAITKAVQRGVDVKVMVPATSATDSPIVQHASHYEYGRLMRAGVKIYEYKLTLLHQKVLIVDGVWACVGSTNFDDRSFQLNDEISMGVLDRTIARELRDAFASDLRNASQQSLERWSHRGLWHKLIDQLGYLGSSEL